MRVRTAILVFSVCAGLFTNAVAQKKVGRYDAQILEMYRAIYGAASLQRYEMDPQKPIRIIVENGHATLYGVVDSAMDKQIAGTQASSVPGVFNVNQPTHRFK